VSVRSSILKDGHAFTIHITDPVEIEEENSQVTNDTGKTDQNQDKQQTAETKTADGEASQQEGVQNTEDSEEKAEVEKSEKVGKSCMWCVIVSYVTCHINDTLMYISLS